MPTTTPTTMTPITTPATETPMDARPRLRDPSGSECCELSAEATQDNRSPDDDHLISACSKNTNSRPRSVALSTHSGSRPRMISHNSFVVNLLFTTAGSMNNKKPSISWGGRISAKMPFRMGWSHATLTLKVFRCEFGHEIWHK